MFLIIIINPIWPALVFPKLVKTVQNLPQAGSAILSITSLLNKFVKDIPRLIVGFPVISLDKEFKIIAFSAENII